MAGTMRAARWMGTESVVSEKVARPEPETGEALVRVALEEEGALLHLTLNRPKALNALTHGMIQSMTELLDGWATTLDAYSGEEQVVQIR